MKIYIHLIAAIFFLSYGDLYSQPKASFGVSFGRGTSTFGGGSLDYSENKQNNRVGVLFNFASSELFSIEHQVNTERKGAYINTPEGQVGLRVSDIQTPLLFKLSIPIAGNLYPTIFAGPYYASSINQTRELINRGESELAYTDINIARFDVGTTFGVGGRFVLDSLFQGIGARSDYGLKRIGDIRYDGRSRSISHSINASASIFL